MMFKETINGAITAAIDRCKGMVDRVDNRVNTSTFGRVFRLKGCGHVRIRGWVEEGTKLMLIGGCT